MRHRWILASFVALALTGCTHATTAEIWAGPRAEWVAEHRASITSDVAEAIRDGRVIPGMTLAEAKAAWMGWGDVERVNRQVVGDVVQLEHVFQRGIGRYADYRYLYTRGGRVVAAHATVADRVHR